jgi:integrase
MTIVRIKGVKRYKSPKNGVWYTYHRASGTRLEPPHIYGSPEFFAALTEAENKLKGKEPIPHTWGAAVKGYRRSPAFTELATRTKTDYENVLLWLKNLDAMPLSSFSKPFCYKLRDKAFRKKKRRFANYVSTVLSLVLGHAVRYGMGITENHAYGIEKIKRDKDAPEPNVPWLPNEIEAFLSVAPPHIATPFATAYHLGMRGQDVLKLPKTAYRDGKLHVKTSKTGIEMTYPVPASLRERLDAMPEHNGLRLFINLRKKPWTGDGFRHQVFTIRDSLAKSGKLRKQLTLHGLRTTLAQEAADLGIDEKKIADGLGHRDTKTTRVYVREAGRKRNLGEVVETVAKAREEAEKG